MGGAPLRHPPAHHPPGCRLLGPAPHRLDPRHPSCRRCHPLEPQAPEKPLVLAAHLDQRGTRQTQCDRTLLWPRLPLVSLFSCKRVSWITCFLVSRSRSVSRRAKILFFVVSCVIFSSPRQLSALNDSL